MARLLLARRVVSLTGRSLTGQAGLRGSGRQRARPYATSLCTPRLSGLRRRGLGRPVLRVSLGAAWRWRPGGRRPDTRSPAPGTRRSDHTARPARTGSGCAGFARIRPAGIRFTGRRRTCSGRAPGQPGRRCSRWCGSVGRGPSGRSGSGGRRHGGGRHPNDGGTPWWPARCGRPASRGAAGASVARFPGDRPSRRHVILVPGGTGALRRIGAAR